MRHLAALETILAFFWTASLLAADRALGSRRPVLGMMAAGAVWSLSVLTKIHGWFLLPMLAVWSLVRLPPRRALLAITVWTVVGLALFWAGWPWLWFDTWARIWRYWGTGVERVTIRVEYFGRVFADRDVPWHYPWLYFGATVPVGLQALGLLGVVRRLEESTR